MILLCDTEMELKETLSGIKGKLKVFLRQIRQLT